MAEGRVRRNGKVLVIGLDGATWDLIRAWGDDLPTFRQLMGRGVVGDLRSTSPPISAPAWTSFTTGKNPGKHGIYNFSKPRKRGYSHVSVSSRDRKSEAIWHMLGRYGGRTGVINVPLTYPPERLNGFMVTGFPTPERKRDFTYPRELLGELEEEIPGFRPQPSVAMEEGREDEFFHEISTINDMTLQATIYLMNRYDWELLITVFGGPDAMSHRFWKYMDPSHPLHDKRNSKNYGQAIRLIYKQMDASIRTLIAEVEKETTIFIMSDHGFGPLHYVVSVNALLLGLGLLKLKPSPVTRLRYWAFRSGLNSGNLYSLTRRIYRTIKGLRLRRKGSAAAHGSHSRSTLLTKMMHKVTLSLSDVDWSRTKAYSFGNAQLYLNLEGRDPAGIVKQDEHHEVMNCVAEALRNLRDPETEEAIFDFVAAKTEVYEGPFLRDAPDVVFYDSEGRYSVAPSAPFWQFRSSGLTSPHPQWSGTHRQEGILIAHGPDIRQRYNIPDCHIVDLAPTVLHLLQTPVPSDVDGKVLNSIFRRGSPVANRPVEYVASDWRKTRIEEGGRVYTPEEELEVQKRLRELGYL